MHQKTGEVHEYINYCLFQNTKDVNLPEIRLKKGENAGNGLNNAFGIKEARMKNSIAKLNDEYLRLGQNKTEAGVILGWSTVTVETF